MEGPGPEYPADLPELRRELLVIDYDSGPAVAHHWQLYRTARVDQYRVVEEEREWRGRHGWARVLGQVRQRFPRVRAEWAR